MAADDSEFQFDLSTDDERLLLQLATDAEAKDSIGSLIDALPARPDCGAESLKQDGGTTQDVAAAAVLDETGECTTSVLLADGTEASNSTLKRALDDAEAAEADSSAAKRAPAPEDFEEELDDGRSPLQKFRTYPRRPLTVTDLTSGAWCELQYWYTLSRLPGGRRTRTAAMKQGSKLHQKLEDEVHTTVEVQIMSREDGFGLRLWNLIQGLRTLRRTGLTRELEIWGILDGNLVNGVIDSLSHDNPNPDFEFELSQEVEPEKKGQCKVTDFFKASKPNTPKRNGPKVYLADVKTRGSLRKVSNSLLRPAKIQLLLYHLFLSDLAAWRLDFFKVMRRYGLKPDETFSDGFLAQMVGLHEEADSPSSSWQTVDEEAEPTSSTKTMATSPLEYRSLRELLRLVKNEVNLTFPEEDKSMGSILRVQYIYREDGREIGHHDFPVSRTVLNEYLAVYMAWWRGERKASGVDLEEAYKCRTCEFAEVCTWREDMDAKRVEKVKERLRAAKPESGSE